MRGVKRNSRLLPNGERKNVFKTDFRCRCGFVTTEKKLLRKHRKAEHPELFKETDEVSY
jgi:hypothetical protein